MNPVITIKHIGKIFDEELNEHLTVLKNINLEIGQGEFFVFVGPSGSGKSTLLRIMSGLEKDYEGEIVLGSGITPLDMSFVFQQFAILPWLTVFQNIELPLIARGVLVTDRHGKVMEELRKFRLEKFAHSRPRDLSGGMRQRVGVARALITNPKIVFMDEPFSELDSFTAEELREELLALWQERRPTIVMVTHIIEEAIQLADRITVLTPRPGMVEKVVQNHLPRPRLKRSEEFYRLEDQLYKLIRP